MSAQLAFKEPMPGISPGVYDAADFRAVAEIVRAGAGIVLADNKAMLVYSRLAPMVRESGCGTFAAYIEGVRRNPEQQARVIAALTTNHTFFYREAHHFEHFAGEVRPALLQRLAAGGSIRLWSAGCSSGEETWSLMMTLLGGDRGAGRKLAGQDILTLASDIAPHALSKASAATYGAADLEPVPAALRDAWTKIAGDKATIADEARRLVRFRTLNLHGEWPMRRPFDVIFCRNVMIYFDHPTKERLIGRFVDALAPGGHLYIGHSERVTGAPAERLEPVGATIYRKVR